MILFALSDPSRYELLINAILEAISINPEMKEDYEQLIQELNQSLTSRTGVQAGGYKVPGERSEVKSILHQAAPWTESIGGSSATGTERVLQSPAKLDTQGRRNIYTQQSGSYPRYDYLQRADTYSH